MTRHSYPKITNYIKVIGLKVGEILKSAELFGYRKINPQNIFTKRIIPHIIKLQKVAALNDFNNESKCRRSHVTDAER